MEAKKSKEANLEDKIIVFRSVGLVMVSAIVLMAFTRTTADIAAKVAETEKNDGQKEEILYDLIIDQPEPEQEETVAPPPPAPEEVKIEEDDKEIEEVRWVEEVEGPPADEKEEEKIVDEPISDFSDVEPVYPGGPAAMNAFIQSKVVYPELSKEMDEQGTVYVQFVVNKDGTIQDVIVLKGVSELLDKEAVRVVKLMPKWTPGEQAGKAVRVRYQIPINFRIQ